MEKTVVGNLGRGARIGDGEGREVQVAGQIFRGGGGAMCLQMASPALDAHPGGILAAEPLVLSVSWGMCPHLGEEGTL
jgi:hypothetical protein